MRRSLFLLILSLPICLYAFVVTQTSDKIDSTIYVEQKVDSIAQNFYKSPSSSVVELEQYLKSASNSRDTISLTRILLLLGRIESFRGQYDCAIDKYFSVLNLRPDTTTLFTTYEGLAATYLQSEKYEKALSYALTASSYATLNDQKADNLNLIGNIHYMADNLQAALDYLEQAKAHYLQNGQEKRAAMVLANIGNVYDERAQYERALEHYLATIEIYQRPANYDRKSMSWIYSITGATYLHNNQYDQGSIFLDSATRISIDYNVVSWLDFIKDSYVDYHQGQGNYQTALIMHKKYSALVDSIEEAIQNQRIAEIEGNYAGTLTSKENEINQRIIESENLKAKNQYLLLTIISLLLILSATAAWHFRERAKHNQKRNETLVQASARLEEVNEKLKKSNNDLEEFASIASHDLKSPLFSIKSFTYVLKDKLNGKVDAYEYKLIGLIDDSAKLMTNLIDNILAHSHLEKAIPKVEKIVVKDLFDEIRNQLNHDIVESRSQTTFESAIPFFYGDRVAFLQVLINLIGNGIKFKNRDQNPIITVSIQQKDTDWSFCVSDNGIGIHKEDCESIFEPRKKLNTEQFHKGSGLGLAICKKVVVSHGGRIWVDSEPGMGSRFCFTIPLKVQNDVRKSEILNEAVA
jgi:signal transduction histidine kinase